MRKEGRSSLENGGRGSLPSEFLVQLQSSSEPQALAAPSILSKDVIMKQSLLFYVSIEL
jgi:hypothetical protein